MKKLLLSLLFITSCAFAQATYPFIVTPQQYSATVSQLVANAPVQEVSTPLVVSLPASASASHVFTVSTITLPVVNTNTYSNGMITFTINIGNTTYIGPQGLLTPGQTANIYLNVDTSQLAPATYGLPIFIQDMTTGLDQSADLTLTVSNNRTYVYPANNVRVVPHIATGLGWNTTLVFTNANTSGTQLAVTFKDQNGLPINIALKDGRYSSYVYVNVAPNTVATITATQPTATYTIIATATIIPVSGYPVGVTAIYTTNATTATESGVPAQQVNTGALTMFYDNTNGKVTGLALMNSLNYAEPVTITVYDEFGDVLETLNQNIPANGQTATVLNDSTITGHTGVIHASMGFNALNGFVLRFDQNNYFIPVVPILY